MTKKKNKEQEAQKQRDIERIYALQEKMKIEVRKKLERTFKNVSMAKKTASLLKPVVSLDPKTRKLLTVFQSANELKEAGYNPSLINRICSSVNREEWSSNEHDGKLWTWLEDYEHYQKNKERNQ